MSYTFLLEQGEESSAESFSAIPAFVLSKLKNAGENLSCNGNAMESSQNFQSGTISERLTEHPGAEKLMSFAADSHARISALAGQVSGYETEKDPDYGLTWPEQSMTYDQDSFSWRIRRGLFPEDSISCSVTLPDWGMMLSGELLALMPLALTTTEPDYGWLPTMRKCIATHGICWKRAEDGTPKGNLEDYLAYLYVKNGGSRLRGLSIHPSFACLMMGWPIGWTALQPLEMDKFQQWLRLHGEF